jgi:hypothetical protein
MRLLKCLTALAAVLAVSAAAPASAAETVRLAVRVRVHMLASSGMLMRHALLP